MTVLLMDTLDYNICEHIQNSVAYVGDCLAPHFVWEILHECRIVMQFLFGLIRELQRQY